MSASKWIRDEWLDEPSTFDTDEAKTFLERIEAVVKAAGIDHESRQYKPVSLGTIRQTLKDENFWDKDRDVIGLISTSDCLSEVKWACNFQWRYVPPIQQQQELKAMWNGKPAQKKKKMEAA